MTSRFIDFLNANTGWRKAREFVDKQEHRKASYKSFKSGVPVENGYMSEIIALTFGDNQMQLVVKMQNLFYLKKQVNLIT